MMKIRLVPILAAAIVSFHSFAEEEPNTVTGYHHFLSSSGSDEDEEEAFGKAQSKAYQQCYERGMRPRRASDWELMFPSLMGVGDSNCRVSEVSIMTPRHYECTGWYKAVCVAQLPETAESSEDSSSYQDDGSGGTGGYGGDGAGGSGGGYANDGAEGAPGY